MSRVPVDEHSEEYEQLAGLDALHALEGDELARFAAHVADCQRCQVMVRLDRRVLALLSLAAPEMEPSPDFKARLLQRGAEELQHTQVREPARILPFRRRAPYLSALAAVLVTGLVVAGGFTYENQTVGTYALSGSGPGSAQVVVRRSGAAELDMHGVPDPDPGWVYEAWVIPPGKDPVAAGTLATGEARVPLSGDLKGSTIAITRERGRVDAPTSPPLMATVVQS